MEQRAACYGRMFPPASAFSGDADVNGIVFRCQIERFGMVGKSCYTGVDEAAWDRCTTCRDFDTCYRLSAGVLLMHLATRG